eukprot:227409_1
MKRNMIILNNIGYNKIVWTGTLIQILHMYMIIYQKKSVPHVPVSNRKLPPAPISKRKLPPVPISKRELPPVPIKANENNIDDTNIQTEEDSKTEYYAQQNSAKEDVIAKTGYIIPSTPKLTSDDDLIDFDFQRKKKKKKKK